MRCFAYSFPNAFDIEKLSELLSEKKYIITKFEEVYHVKLNLAEATTDGDVFIFLYGAVVTWGLQEEQELQICSLLTGCFAEKLGAVDDDLYTYVYDKKAKSAIKDDIITLPNSDILTKLACSYGLAQSVKLGGFEVTIQNIFASTRALPESLARKGSVPLSRKTIRKLMGKIFMERASINLHLELLDAPNFFWDNTELEPIHEMIVEYMEQEKRVSILNQRLGVIQELLDMLATELNNQHSTKLEWTIIILIFVEVIVMLSKEIFHII